ncbi:MAG: T6SS immunity protein Tdi1 domain-containing protein [Sphingomicrobium sp.]
MNSSDYFLPERANQADLSLWSPILPSETRVLRTNLFGDAFVLVGGGAVHMLERAAHSAERIALSEQAFWREVGDDTHGWQLRGLADQCRRAGKILADGQCYAFTKLPVLGGDYTVENVRVASWEDWFSFTADLFQQIKDLPDEAAVRLKIVE